MLSGDNGILQKATDAKTTSERAEAKEQAKMDIMAYIADKTANHQDASLDDEKVKEILSDNKSYVKEAKDSSFITAKGEYEISYSELYTASDTPQMATLPAGTYTEGQEVTVGGEKFFVLEDLGSTVKLLAKYCLNQEGIEQENVITSSSGRAFSNTYYWTNVSEVTDPCDLQTEPMILAAEEDGNVSSTVKNAVIAARDYGIAKQVELGRLMTYTEANDIATNGTDTMKNILFGNWTGEDAPMSGYLRFWLGTSNDELNRCSFCIRRLYLLG